MISIFEVARFFLSLESMTHLKLQKLCYYAQAWHLALFGRPLVEEEFQAWLHGPVAPALYVRYKEWGNYEILRYDGDLNIPIEERSFLFSIFRLYGMLTGKQLEERTHQEAPWKNARKGVSEGSYCQRPISQDDMREFYRGLLNGENREKN